MQARSTPEQLEFGPAGAGPLGGSRDADWMQGAPGLAAPLSPAGLQLLHRWHLPVGESASGLVFWPLDGNPRHGVLGLLRSARPELADAIEILERQGRWLVMPDSRRACGYAQEALTARGPGTPPRSNITGTPDRRFVFFNALREGGTVVLVERRRGDVSVLS
jgi:hypothetical protein